MKIAVIGAGVSGAAFYDAIDTDRHEVSFFDKGRGMVGVCLVVLWTVSENLTMELNFYGKRQSI